MTCGCVGENGADIAVENLKVDRQYFGTIHSRATYLTSNFESEAKIVVVPLFVLLFLSWSFLMSWTPIGCFLVWIPVDLAV